MPYGQVAGQVLGLIGAGVAGGLNAGTQTDIRNQQLAAYAGLTPAPDYQQMWMNGLNFQNQQTPLLANSDFALRSQLAPKEMAQAYQLYHQYAPGFAMSNRRALSKSDPEFMNAYKNLAQNYETELGAGRGLTGDQLGQAQNDIRAAQAARGNVLGNSPVSEEGLYTTGVRDAMYQRRLGNMQNFVNGSGPEARYGAMMGAGAGALSGGVGAMATPGFQYFQQPMNYGPQFVQNASLGWQQNNQNQRLQDAAAFGAPPDVNPWIASLSAGFGALAGSKSGGAVSTGTGMAGFGGGGGGGLSQSGTGFGQQPGGSNWSTDASVLGL